MNKVLIKERLATAKTLSHRVWIGKVVDTRDPDMNSRVKVEIDGLTNGIERTLLPWYSTAQSFGSGSNSQSNLPPVNSRVRVSFPTDDIYNGIVEYSIASVPPK